MIYRWIGVALMIATTDEIARTRIGVQIARDLECYGLLAVRTTLLPEPFTSGHLMGLPFMVVNVSAAPLAAYWTEKPAAGGYAPTPGP